MIPSIVLSRLPGIADTEHLQPHQGTQAQFH
jgi:hypothetical protein